MKSPLRFCLILALVGHIQACNENKSGAIPGDTIPLIGQPSSQSSTYDASKSTPDKAVDGNTDGAYNGGSCMHTLSGESLRWWMVDMGSSQCVGRVSIFNRADCCAGRLEGAIVRVGPNSNRDNPACGTITLDQINAGQEIDVTCDLEGRYISIELPGTQALHVCEVQAVTGQCQAGSDGTSGEVYVRWGRTTCPSNSELAYAGIVGGKFNSHEGSGSNYLCLPEDPEYDEYQEGANDYRGLVYSTEYQIYDFPPFAGKESYDVPCAVCRTTNRGSVMMIPAKMTCPSSWTEEYHGYLMAERYNYHQSSEFVCVDRNPDVVPGSSVGKEAALLFPVESRCTAGSLPCGEDGPYIHGGELTCVVCSK